jgi:hypothetical protein
VPPVQAVLQSPQWLSSVVRSEHDAVHRFGAVAGQPVMHPAPPPSIGPQTGVVPLHVFWHDPQFPWDERSTSHPSLGLVEQWA